MRSALVYCAAAIAVTVCTTWLPGEGFAVASGGLAAEDILRQLRTGSANRAVKYFDSLPESTEITLAMKKIIAPRLRMAGNFGRARTLFEEILDADPRDDAAARGLAMTLFDVGDYEGAQRLLLQLAEGELPKGVKLPEVVSHALAPVASESPAKPDLPQEPPEVVKLPVPNVPVATNTPEKVSETVTPRIPAVPDVADIPEEVVQVVAELAPEPTNLVEIHVPIPIAAVEPMATSVVGVTELVPTCEVDVAPPLTNVLTEPVSPPTQEIGVPTGTVTVVTQVAPEGVPIAVTGTPGAVATKPRDMAAYIAMLLVSNKTTAAVNLFELLPEDAVLPAAIKRSIAGCYEEAGDYAHAARLYATVFDEDPKDAETGLAMVNLYGECDQDAALAAAEKVLKYHPDNVPVLFAKAQIDAVKNNRDEAVASCQRILTLDATHGPARELCLGLLLSGARAGGEGASAFYEKALAVDNSADVRMEYIQSLLAMARGQSGEEAAASYAKLAALGDTGENVLAEQAEVLAGLGRAEKAVAAFEALGAEYDPSQKLLRVVGEFYRETRAFDKAIPVYQTLVATNPNDDELKRALVVLYFDKGDFKSAVKALDDSGGESVLQPSTDVRQPVP